MTGAKVEQERRFGAPADTVREGIQSEFPYSPSTAWAEQFSEPAPPSGRVIQLKVEPTERRAEDEAITLPEAEVTTAIILRPDFRRSEVAKPAEQPIPYQTDFTPSRWSQLTDLFHQARHSLGVMGCLCGFAYGLARGTSILSVDASATNLMATWLGSTLGGAVGGTALGMIAIASGRKIADMAKQAADWFNGRD